MSVSMGVGIRIRMGSALSITPHCISALVRGIIEYTQVLSNSVLVIYGNLKGWRGEGGEERVERRGWRGEGGEERVERRGFREDGVERGGGGKRSGGRRDGERRVERFSLSLPVDVNECAVNNGCVVCTDSTPSYTCSCNPGTR